MGLLAIAETRGGKRPSEQVGERIGLGPVLERRAKFLDPQDQKLLELTLPGRLSRREVGLLLGITHGSVTRRIHRIMKLLHDPMVVALIEDGQFLPELHREVGLAHFLWRWPVGRIEQKFEIGRYRIKRMLEHVRGWQLANQRRRG